MKKTEQFAWAVFMVFMLVVIGGFLYQVGDTMRTDANRKFDCSRADRKEMSDFMRECVIHSGHNSDKCRRDGNAIYCDEIFEKEQE